METCLAGLQARGLSPHCIYDIGAADGQWTRSALNLWPGADYILFEPLSERAGDLDRLAAEHSQVKWHQCGLGRTPTTLSLSLSSNLYESSFAYGGSGSRQVKVECLDALLAAGRIPQGDFMKIDVQGFEFEVLAGAVDFLQGVQVVILESYFHRFAPTMKLVHEAVAYMHKEGFRVYEILDQMRRPHDNAIGQCDICFVREGHALLASNLWHGSKSEDSVHPPQASNPPPPLIHPPWPR